MQYKPFDEQELPDTRLETQTQSNQGICAKIKGDYDEEYDLKITFFKQTNLKNALYWIFLILTSGLLYLFQRWFLSLELRLKYVTSSLDDATHFVVKKYKKGIKAADDMIVEKKQFTLDDKDVFFFQYEYLKFIIDGNQLKQVINTFAEFTNTQIIEKNIGLDALSYKQLYDDYYGPNIMDVEIKSYWELLINEVLTPFNIFQAFAIILWSYDSYLYYAMLILFLTVLEIIVSLRQLKENLLKIREMIAFTTQIKVFRNNNWQTVGSDTLCPGDVFEMKSYSKIPCDAIIIQGACVVNEAILTGESIPINKTALINNDILFKIQGNESSILYSGTQTLKSEAVCIVYRTGFTTAKGSLARSIIFSKSTTFSFEQDSHKYLLFLAFLGLLLALLSAWMQYRLEVSGLRTLLRALEVFTIIVPPALPTALAAGISLSISRLKGKNISCVKIDKINVAGIINVCAFDKTGTLTELGLDVVGFRAAKNQGFSKQLPINGAHGAISNLFATCHSLVQEKGNLLGDPLDLSMFKATNASLSANNIQHNGKLLIFHKRFDFVADLQRMSVIIEDDTQYSLYCKGSPEAIRSLCFSNSIPQNYSQVLEMYSKDGFRVIACAYKNISQSDAHQTRQQIEFNLIFLGFIIFENKLKPESKSVIQQLQQAKIDTLMVTGDNIYTATNLAYQCGILKSNRTLIASLNHTLEWTELHQQKDNNIKLDESYYSVNQNERASIIEPCKDDQLIISGVVFQYIFDNYFKQIELYSTILKQVKVYARMKPNNKGDLMTLLQQQPETYVSFCGDGTNDTCALRQADIGLALSQEEASLAAPFSSTILNITGVFSILTEGRAAIVTSVECFKFLTMYAVLQTVSIILLYITGDDLTSIQYLYIDLWLIVPLSFTMTLSKPLNTLSSLRPCCNLISSQVISSLAIIASLAIIFQAFIRNLFMSQEFYQQDKTIYQTSDDIAPDPLNTIIITGLYTQVLSSAIAYTQGPPFRESIINNRYFMFFCLSAFLIHLVLTLMPQASIFNFLLLTVGYPMYFRLYMILIQFAMAIVIISYEKIVNTLIYKEKLE